MPLYEYVCQSCGTRFEKMVRFSEQDKQPECPECSSKETRKQISLFASGNLGLTTSTSSCSSSSGGFR